MTPTCEYVASADDCATGHTDAEVISGNVVTCTAPAETVIRPKGRSIRLGTPWRTKMAVCNAHGRYLVAADPEDRPPNPRLWEFDAMDPETVVGTDPTDTDGAEEDEP